MGVGAGRHGWRCRLSGLKEAGSYELGRALTAVCAPRKDTSALRAAGAAARAPVAQLPRAPSAIPRAGSATAGPGLGVSSAASVPPATGGSLSRAAGVSAGRRDTSGQQGVPQGPQPATHPTPPTPGCQCQGGHCDVHTGRCTCPQGLSGERCDTCSHQHQVPMPGGPGGHGVHCEGVCLPSPLPQPPGHTRLPRPSQLHLGWCRSQRHADSVTPTFTSTSRSVLWSQRSLSIF